MTLDLTSLKKAVDSLERALRVASSSKIIPTADDAWKDVIRAGVIQNFEFTYELCWKFMQRWLADSLGSGTIAGISRRELFRLAAERRMIGNVDRWMIYHDARNKTAHTYDMDIAKEVYAAAKKFLPDAKKCLKNLESKND